MANFKQFVKRFKWGTLFPAALVVVVGIFLLSFPTTQSRALGISSGVLLTVSGLLCVLSFTFDYDKNVAALLAGVVQLSVAVWLFVSPRTYLWVFALGLTIAFALRAVAGVLDAVASRETNRLWIARIVCLALLVGLAIVVVVNPFERLRDLTIAAGVLLVLDGALAIVAIARSGWFRKEAKERVRGLRELKEDGAEVVRREKPSDGEQENTK